MQIRSTEVSQWASDVGLDKYEGLPNRLEALASSRVDLAYLTDDDWSKLLVPLNIKVGKQRRITHAIRHLRESHAVQALNDADEAEVRDVRRTHGSERDRLWLGCGCVLRRVIYH